MIIKDAKLLFIYYFTYTEYTYVSPTEYDYTIIYEMTKQFIKCKVLKQSPKA
jgi:hypothetical protein